MSANMQANKNVLASYLDNNLVSYHVNSTHNYGGQNGKHATDSASPSVSMICGQCTDIVITWLIREFWLRLLSWLTLRITSFCSDHPVVLPLAGTQDRKGLNQEEEQSEENCGSVQVIALQWSGQNKVFLGKAKWGGNIGKGVPYQRAGLIWSSTFGLEQGISLDKIWGKEKRLHP
jgi:hypothetical protein